MGGARWVTRLPTTHALSPQQESSDRGSKRGLRALFCCAALRCAALRGAALRCCCFVLRCGCASMPHASFRIARRAVRSSAAEGVAAERRQLSIKSARFVRRMSAPWSGRRGSNWRSIDDRPDAMSARPSHPVKRWLSRRRGSTWRSGDDRPGASTVWPRGVTHTLFMYRTVRSPVAEGVAAE